MKICKLVSIVLFALFLAACEGEDQIVEIEKIVEVPASPVVSPQMTYEAEIQIPLMFKGNQDIQSFSLNILGQNNQNNFYEAELWQVLNGEKCFIDSSAIRYDSVYFYNIDNCMDSLFNEVPTFFIQINSLIEVTWDTGTPFEISEITYRSENGNYVNNSFEPTVTMDDNTYILHQPYESWSESEEFILSDVTFAAPEANTEYYIYTFNSDEYGNGYGRISSFILSDENGVITYPVGFTLIEDMINTIEVRTVDDISVDATMTECTIEYSTDELLECPYILAE